MMKIVLAVAIAAAGLTTLSLVTSAKAQGVKMPQVDMRTGLHLDGRDPGHYKERLGYNSDTTVGVGSGRVTIGSGQHCRAITTMAQGGDGRMIGRKERHCD